MYRLVAGYEADGFRHMHVRCRDGRECAGHWNHRSGALSCGAKVLTWTLYVVCKRLEDNNWSQPQLAIEPIRIVTTYVLGVSTELPDPCVGPRMLALLGKWPSPLELTQSYLTSLLFGEQRRVMLLRYVVPACSGYTEFRLHQPAAFYWFKSLVKAVAGRGYDNWRQLDEHPTFQVCRAADPRTDQRYAHMLTVHEHRT